MAVESQIVDEDGVCKAYSPEDDAAHAKDGAAEMAADVRHAYGIHTP